MLESFMNQKSKNPKEEQDAFSEYLEGRGVAQKKVRTFNRQLIMQYLREHGSTLRVNMANNLGLSRATVTKIVQELIEEGFIEEGEKMHGKSQSGKRATEISFRAEAGYIVAIDLGRSRLRLYITDLAAKIVAEWSGPLDANLGWQKCLPYISVKVNELVQESLDEGWKGVRGIGMGMPGWLGLPDNLSIMSQSSPLLENWRGVDIRSKLKELLQLKTDILIYIDNDANLGALGESRYGTGRGVKNMIYLKLSLGIGAGLILNGQLYRGENGVAGEFGHISIDCRKLPDKDSPLCSSCGKRGCLEALAGLRAIVHNTHKYNSLKETDIKPEYMADIILAAQNGDEDCQAALERAGTLIGRAIGNYLINIYNPALIILDGGIIRPTKDRKIYINQLLLDQIRASAKEVSLPAAWEVVTVTTGTLGDDAIGRGAAALVIDRDPILTLSPLGEQTERKG
jgi:predicted NBD/HSP70 family sugar kinase